MKKRGFKMVCSLVLAAVMLVGCGSNGGSEGTASGNGESGGGSKEPIKLVLWGVFLRKMAVEMLLQHGMRPILMFR